jgi:hypothetical protein
MQHAFRPGNHIALVQNEPRIALASYVIRRNARESAAERLLR